MPRIPSPTVLSSLNREKYSPLTPGFDNYAINSIDSKPAVTMVQEVNRIESKHWHKRLISYCKKIIKRIIDPPPSISVKELVDDLTNKYPKYPQKVLVAIKLHTGQVIKLHQSRNGKLGFTNGEVAISTETMEAVVRSIKKNSVELAYEYLRKGKELPEGYLQQVLLPYIHKRIRQTLRYEKKSELPQTPIMIQGRQQYHGNPEQYIVALLNKVGIENERSFTFERMLEFKKELRNNIALSIEEQALVVRRNASSTHVVTVTDPQPSTIRLPEPGKTKHYIEKEDSRHIRKLASGERFFSKIQIKDFGNRIKRSVLRNKRNQIMIALNLLAGAIITVFLPPVGIAVGIAVAVGLATDVGYVTFWTIGSTLWNRVRLSRGLKQIKKYSDFDCSSFDKSSDQKRKELIKKLLFRCKHKTFTQIYNAYAELEKQSEKLKKMAAKEQKSISESIALEKERLLYHERRKKLKSGLFFFDKLIEQVTISRMILERRYKKSFDLLWNEKFKDMEPQKREEIFRIASKNLIVEGHQVKTSTPNWLRNIIKFSSGKPGYMVPGDSQGITLSKAKKLKLFRISGTFKTLTQEGIYRSIKNTIYVNLIKAVKIIGRRAAITIHNPFSGKVGITSTSAFVAFFFLEMAAADKNTRQNLSRVSKIKNKKKDYTWQITGKRVRTGREEVGTLRSQAKEEIEPLVGHLLNSVKSLEEMGTTLEDAQKRSAMLGKGQFGAMSDHDAATLILQHAAWQQLLDKEINSAFSLFHHIVQEKAATWNREIARTLSANGQRVAASKISSDRAGRHRLNSG